MWCDSFHADCKNLIVFALAIWESAKPAPYFEGSGFLIFKTNSKPNQKIQVFCPQTTCIWNVHVKF